jgi:hypothetical protein
MGEAKRRKQIDPTFGNPLHSRRGKADYSHHLAPAPSISYSADAYEEYARRTVLSEQTFLLQQAQGARNRLSYPQKETDLCLIVMRTFNEADQIGMKFARIEETKRIWANVPGYSQMTTTTVNELFEEALGRRNSDEFLWTHMDLLSHGLVVRLIPIKNVKIAEICHL